MPPRAIMREMVENKRFMGWTEDLGPVMCQCWANVTDVGPALTHHWADAARSRWAVAGKSAHLYVRLTSKPDKLMIGDFITRWEPYSILRPSSPHVTPPHLYAPGILLKTDLTFWALEYTVSCMGGVAITLHLRKDIIGLRFMKFSNIFFRIK